MAIQVLPAPVAPQPTALRPGLARAGQTRSAVGIVATIALIGATLLALTVVGHRQVQPVQPLAQGGSSAPTWATPQVARFLGQAASTVHLHAWRSADTAAGPRYVAAVAGLGLVQFDAQSREVDEVVFSQHLAGATGSLIDESTAAATAARYAAGHYTDFSQLTARPPQTLDHRAFVEYRFEWRQLAGTAWTPSAVVIGINARSGAVAYYASNRITLGIDTSPLVTETEAAALAGAVDPTLRPGPAELQVVLLGGEQVLVWEVPLRAAPTPSLHIPEDKLVSIDAETGDVRSVAITS